MTSRPAPSQPSWVRATATVLKVTAVVLWVFWIGVLLLLAVTGVWWAALIVVTLAAWRIGVRALIRRNRAEVEQWQNGRDLRR